MQLKDSSNLYLLTFKKDGSQPEQDVHGLTSRNLHQTQVRRCQHACPFSSRHRRKSKVDETQGLNPLGVGSTVDVKDRPLTTGGGINGPQGGPSQRKVYDRNYYVTKMKEKMMVRVRVFRASKRKQRSSRTNQTSLERSSRSTTNWSLVWKI